MTMDDHLNKLDQIREELSALSLQKLSDLSKTLGLTVNEAIQLTVPAVIACIDILDTAFSDQEQPK